MEPSVTLISNRLPIGVKRIGGRLEFSHTVGGMANGLSSFSLNKQNRWIGWPGIPSDELDEYDKQLITKKLAEQNCVPIFLTKLQIDGFYNGYSNRILWPLFHEQAVSKSATETEAEYMKVYSEVNAAYAHAVLSTSKSGQPVWIHDYQLMLLPALFRSERPKDRIGFFLHIPFPSSENFSVLPESKEIIRGLLGADLIGFHTKAYAHNFLDSARSISAGVVTEDEIVIGGRAVRVADFPMGIDYAKYRNAIETLKVKRELIKLRAKYGRRKVILTVDRLDPSKGLLERTAAYRELLRKNPWLHGKVVMAMLVVPSRTDIAEYQKLKVKFEVLVHDVNKEFGNKLWKPIDYMDNGVPPEQVIPLYRRADIAFIAPLRDGMNLVAKEYLATQTTRRGVLILSQTAGAAQELRDAVIVDPQSQSSLVHGLEQALSMGKTPWRNRLNKMQRYLRTATVQSWAAGFVDNLRATTTATPNRTYKLTESQASDITGAFRLARRRLLLLDYDGTLAAYASRPEDAVPSDKLIELLRKLLAKPHIDVVIISGRPKKNLESWFGNLPVNLVAEHGAFYRTAGSKNWRRTDSADHNWKPRVKTILDKYARATYGSFVEEKETALVWHYRSSQPAKAKKNLILMRAKLAPLAEQYNLRVHNGKKILEIRMSGIDKGTAAKHWLELKPDFVLAAGDDYTDEDTFRAVTAIPNAISIKVGSGRTTARFRIPDVESGLRLFNTL